MPAFRGRWVLSALLLSACAGQGAGSEERRPPAVPHAVDKPKGPTTLDSLPSERVALVPDGTFGPYVGARAEGTIAAWAAETAGKREWRTIAIGDHAIPRGEPKVVADAAPEVNLVAVKALGEGQAKGFVLLSSSREFSGERVDAMALGLHGELVGGPTPIAQSLTDVVWLDAVPTPSGAIAMWAVRRDDRADLFGVEIGPSGDVRDPPHPLFADARAWQVGRINGGVIIAAVTAGKARGENGPLRVGFVDAQAHVEKKSLVLVEGGTAEPDVDLAKIGDRVVVAWSDRREIDPRLYGAVIGGDGALVKPAAPIGRPFGAQALLRIVPPEGRGPAFLAWENLLEQPDGGRAIRLAVLSQDGGIGSSSGLVSLAGSTNAIPELSATEHGVTALTLAPACKRGAQCSAEHPVPTFVTLDAGLDVVAAEPLRLSAFGGKAPDLAWGLSCNALECMALTSGEGTPALVLSVKLTAQSNDWEPAGRRATSDPPPRVTEILTTAKSERVAELAVAKVSTGSLVAWVTDFDPTTPFSRSRVAAPDGKYEPPRAVVRVQSLPNEGAPPDPTVISYRAHSLGGTALVAGDTTRQEALLVWTGVDNKEPQVFATLLGAGGKKITQKMLTHVKGGVSDVAATFVGDGFVVGWIEEHSGASEVHVVRVDGALKAVLPDRRLSGTASTATSVQLVTRGDHVFAAWSDARGPSSGVADVFAMSLTAKDLAPVGSEHRLAQTPGHSRSPVMAPFGEGAVVAWVEEPPTDGESKTATLMVTRLDSGAEPVGGSAATIALDGSPEGLGVECGTTSCHIAATVAAGDARAITAVEWRADAVNPRRLVRLAGTARDAIAPVVLGGDVFYADESDAGDARVRRMRVAWQ